MSSISRALSKYYVSYSEYITNINCCNEQNKMHIVGSTGSTGPTGQTGAWGATGSLGTPGSLGPTGPTGDSATIGIDGVIFYQNNTPSIGLENNYNALSISNINENQFIWEINKYGRSSIILPEKNDVDLIKTNDAIISTATINDIKYRVFVFTEPEKILSFKVFLPSNKEAYVDMCLIGGGGGGSRGENIGSASGAGAGTLIFMNKVLLVNSSYSVYIGRGGKGSDGNPIYKNGENGENTFVKNMFPAVGNITEFVATGGAGAVANSTNNHGKNGTTKSFEYYPAYKTGETSSSGSGGVGGVDYIGKGGNSGPNIPFSLANQPYEGRTPVTWSYGTNGGDSSESSISGKTNAGGGGGAYTQGGNGTINTEEPELNGTGGIGGKGFTIYFDNNQGRDVCGGSYGTGYSEPTFNNNFSAGTSGYFNNLNPEHKNALDNSGSGGGSVIGDSSIKAGDGGSGIFMIRYQI